MLLDLQSGAVDWRDAYRLFLGFINPRPIALVSTISTAGLHNLAPYSFYNMVSANPPVVIVCPSTRRDQGPKDTLRNIEATHEFVIATVTEAIAAPMARCAAALPHGESEFEFSGLTPVPAKYVRASAVKESPVNMECRLRQIVRLGDQPGSGVVVFGDVIAAHLADELLTADRQSLDPNKLRTVGRLGGKYYATVTSPFELEIPEVG